MTQPQTELVKKILRKGFNADRWVCRIRYRSTNGELTERVISPSRISRGVVHALCLCREEHRNFMLNRISYVELVPAADVLMPVPITTLTSKEPNDES